MKINKQTLISIILVSLSCLLFIVAICLILNINYFEFSNKGNNQKQLEEVSSNTNLQSNNNNRETNDSIVNESNNIENNSVDSNNNIVEDNKLETNFENSINEAVVKNEMDVVSYFESQNNMLIKDGNQENQSLREKAKNTFVTIVDFIFYDKEIKGYTFKELTTTAKLKVIKLALTIDYKIDEYFPDYKEVIKDKYDNIKGKLATKYLEFTSNLCDSVGTNTCEQTKEDFNTMKESFGFTWELIKELASSGSSKVKEFYESWRDHE